MPLVYNSVHRDTVPNRDTVYIFRTILVDHYDKGGIITVYNVGNLYEDYTPEGVEGYFFI